MNNFFDAAFEHALRSEGGYVNDPKDPGGATKFGVANFREKLSAYEQFIGRQVSDDEIKNLTIPEAKRFYYHMYFKTIGADQITKNKGIAIAMTDTCILYGIRPTSQMIQRACMVCGALLLVDGVIGKITTKILNEIDQEDFLNAFVQQIELRINKLVELDPVKKKFKKGWLNRTRHLITLAKLEPCVRKLINNKT